MPQRVLITGGGGFIGRETARKLVASGYHVVCFDLAEQIARHRTALGELHGAGTLCLAQGSILDRNALRKAMDRVDVVIHMAAMLGVEKTERDKLGCMEVNVYGTDNVLSAAVAHGVNKFVFASSSEVYGEPERNPIKETDDTKGKTVYAVSKLAGEELVKGYHQRYPSMEYTIVRFFNTYGEGQVAQFVLAKWVMNVLDGRNPVVYGRGTQVRSYGHVDDVTEGVKAIIEKSVSNGKVYNLGNSGEVRNLRELAQLVIDLLAPGGGLEVEVLDGFDGADRAAEREIYQRYCDTSLAERDLGYEATITVEEGIRRIAAQAEIHADWPSV